ncbi:phosphoribosyltransferase-like protein [Penicillium herquei]|nr:phosphoribosyltransferase-like protein [Penicillium herquei]
MTFRNVRHGDFHIEDFAKSHLFPFVGDRHKSLRNMVSSVPDFPRPGVNFRHVLNINQRAGGISLCADLLALCYPGDWDKVDEIVCCQAGGYPFAPTLAAAFELPLVPIREAGKLPPPTISVKKSCSHISSSTSDSPEKRIEIGRAILARGSSVVVVDDMFASGRTLCDILTLLQKAQINIDNITVMVVAEFPAHRGRQRLLENGFGRVNVQSLLVFDGE